MKIRYVWKEISEDGLVKEPKSVGPYYSQENLNGWEGGFDSKEEAIAALRDFVKRYKYDTPRSLILIEEYYPREEE